MAKHPGVRIKKRALPSGRFSWRAHFTDPETGREQAVTLEHSTKEAREGWARRKSAELARARLLGAEPKPAAPPPTALDDAIDAYLKDGGARLRPKTLATYKLAFAHFREWARAEGVASTADLGSPHLASLRSYLVRAKKNRPRAEAPRGAREATDLTRSPVSVNRELRTLKTLLGAWRTQALLPLLHRDDISDALKALPVDRDEPTFYSAGQLKKLLQSALRHDAACFKATREEHAGKRAKGSTTRHVPIAPFLALVLLTGMRRGEALALDWKMVDLEALDHEGRKVGEVRLPARVTKTRIGRTIGLEVSPSLRRIVAALKLRDGGAGLVFAGYTGDLVQTARRRLVKDFGAPPFEWQALRSTAATYLTNATGIFGAASVFMSAKQLGHSVVVAERHYLGVHRGIPRDARTLDAAMQVEKELADILGAIGGAAERRAAK